MPTETRRGHQTHTCTHWPPVPAPCQEMEFQAILSCLMSRCWESTTNPLETQYAFCTTEPTLHPHHLFLLTVILQSIWPTIGLSYSISSSYIYCIFSKTRELYYLWDLLSKVVNTLYNQGFHSFIHRSYLALLLYMGGVGKVKQRSYDLQN